ncbi:MAG: hypothetical protein KJN98_08395 [Pontiella sp.]|nr:hypothetical protein [Pontiella sp.]
MREYKTMDGEAYQGEIQDFNPQTDKLTIRTDGRKTLQLSADTLVDEDYIYVRDWDAVRRFDENTDFRITISCPESKNKWAKYLWYRPPGKREPMPTHQNFHNRMSYRIKYDNQTGYDLENVELKYCIYYNQERIDHWKEEKVTDLVMRPVVHKYAIIPDGQNDTFDSASVVLRRKEIFGGEDLIYLEGDGNRLKGEMVGLIFRATIETASGQSTAREIRVPADLSEEYVWVEPTPENTVWPDDDLDEREDTQKPPTRFEEMGGKEDDEE